MLMAAHTAVVTSTLNVLALSYSMVAAGPVLYVVLGPGVGEEETWEKRLVRSMRHE